MGLRANQCAEHVSVPKQKVGEALLDQTGCGLWRAVVHGQSIIAILGPFQPETQFVTSAGDCWPWSQNGGLHAKQSAWQCLFLLLVNR